MKTVPESEKILNGNQRRSTPVSPSKSSQQFVTRNGGSANATIAIARKKFFDLLSSALSQSANKRPRLAASNVVNPLTSRLFLSNGQFIGEIFLSTLQSQDPSPAAK